MSIASDMADEGRYAIKRLAEIEQARKGNCIAILNRVEVLCTKSANSELPLTALMLASHAHGMVEAAEVAGLLTHSQSAELAIRVDKLIFNRMGS